MKTKLFTLILLLNAYLAFAGTPYKCTIKGEVIGRDSKTLLLIKASDAHEANRQLIEIKDHKFEFTFDVKEDEAYNLIFEEELNGGSWQTFTFFPTAGTVNFKFYPRDQSDKNEITGGELNKAYMALKAEESSLFGPRRKANGEQQDALQQQKKYYSHARDSLYKIIMSNRDHSNVDQSVYVKIKALISSGDDVTPEAKKVLRANDSIQIDVTNWRYKYINSHINTLSYYLLLRDVYSAKNSNYVANALNNAYPKFAAKYPNHSYTPIIGNELNALYKVKAGQPLVDFTAPDLAGKSYRLSDLAKGKITLLDMWGSWCGPCISATRTMVPVYNEFKDKGFTIIGIAREFKTTKDLALTLKREQYPWLNLVDLDDKQAVWNKYGISNGSGMMVLLDKDGKIIAVDPTADQVRKAIRERSE